MSNEFQNKVAQYVIESDECIEAQKAEINSLRARVGSQKTASGRSVSVNTDAVRTAVDSMVDAGFIKQAEHEQAVSAIVADPSALIGFVSKLASNTIEYNRTSVPRLGKASTTQKTASAAESDNVWANLVQSLNNK
jgi:hypothetical protein